MADLDEDKSVTAAVEHAEVHMAAAKEIDALNQKLRDAEKVNLKERSDMVADDADDLPKTQMLHFPCEGDDRIILRPDRTLGGW